MAARVEVVQVAADAPEQGERAGRRSSGRAQAALAELHLPGQPGTQVSRESQYKIAACSVASEV